MRRRHLGLIAALALVVAPSPAQAQGDFIKDKVKELIAKSGVYLSASTRTSIDDDVDMAPSWGIGYGTAGAKRTGLKIPFSFSSYRGNLETTADDVHFGQFKARQLLSGIGYQWVRGRMVYGAKLGLGVSFNRVELQPGAAVAFGVPEPVLVDVSNSFVVKPQVKAEYFVIPKVSLRTQLSYTYTDPDVVVETVMGRVARQWHPHHFQASVAVGVFPFRK